jgi:hypothetical protein
MVITGTSSKRDVVVDLLKGQAYISGTHNSLAYSWVSTSRDGFLPLSNVAFSDSCCTPVTMGMTFFVACTYTGTRMVYCDMAADLMWFC